MSDGVKRYENGQPVGYSNRGLCDECGGDVGSCECTDVTILYCQGCGAATPTDGLTCPPSCPVQLFPTRRPAPR
jgi:hypothetical protein